MTLATLLLIIALILAVLAAANVSSPKVGLFPLAFACFIASLLVPLVG
jgi:uncharacterized integral membrane protein